MIDRKTQKKIVKTTQDFWDKQVQTASFKARARGKEIGHRMADFVDEQTTKLLVKAYGAVYHRSKKGGLIIRSMGDVWFPGGDIFDPINVKTSITGSNGQPNMVSLKKLLNALLDHKIDSYYLLIVKVTIGEKGVVSCKVFLVDLLDYLDYMAYDSGPGQIMLKAGKFFSAIEAGTVPKVRTLGEKVQSLVAILEDGDKRLAINRKAKLDRLKRKASSYEEPKHIVTKETQAGFYFA